MFHSDCCILWKFVFVIFYFYSITNFVLDVLMQNACNEVVDDCKKDRVHKPLDYALADRSV